MEDNRENGTIVPQEDQKPAVSAEFEAHKFKPGESGNPAGRPKGSRNRQTIVREMLDAAIHARFNDIPIIKPVDGETNFENMVAAQIAKALRGDTTAFKELADSGFGKVKDVIEHQGSLIGDVLKEVQGANPQSLPSLKEPDAK